MSSAAAAARRASTGRGIRLRVVAPSPTLPALPVSVQLGILLAVVCALTSVVGFLLKHRGAVAAPPVEWRRPLHSTIELFRSPVYAIGCVVATTSWGFHVGALALAPISVVQSVIAGGLVLVTVLSDRVFGHDVSRREWIGVALSAAGLAFLAATLGATGDSAHADYDGWVLFVVLAVCTLVALALVARAAGTARRSRSPRACCGRARTSRSRRSAARPGSSASAWRCTRSR